MGKEGLRVAYARGASKFVCLSLDLEGQFSRGCEHEHAQAAILTSHLLDVHKAWQQEAAGLATASLGNGDKIAALHGDRPGLGLDGCRLLVPSSMDLERGSPASTPHMGSVKQASGMGHRYWQISFRGPHGMYTPPVHSVRQQDFCLLCWANSETRRGGGGGRALVNRLSLRPHEPLQQRREYVWHAAKSLLLSQDDWPQVA